MQGPEPSVEVVYALPQRQCIVQVALREGMTAREAVTASGLAGEFPEIETRPLLLGIFGRRVDDAQPLRAGDRVEIYRPLKSDPRDARRRTVRQARAENRSGTAAGRR
jgi:putative ubiquitin-RnfH superfamily antitoxin RatB of RatAB toxin-antitoxin module